MRELTLEEQLLISGGTSTELSATNTYDENEIVVVGGDGGGGGGDWGGGDWGGGDYGDYGDGGGGGGGGGDSGTQNPEGEIVVTAPRPTAQCPVNDWWPDFLEDWGDVKALAPNDGPWTQFYKDGNTWCFYDDNDVLQGKYVEDPNGKNQISFTGTNGDGSYSGGAYGFSGGYASGDANGFSYTIPLTRVE